MQMEMQQKTSYLDVLVEFTIDTISYLKIIALKRILEEKWNIQIDVIHAPLPKKPKLLIRKTVPVYERWGNEKPLLNITKENKSKRQKKKMSYKTTSKPF